MHVISHTKSNQFEYLFLILSMSAYIKECFYRNLWHNSVLCSVRPREEAPARAAWGAVRLSWGGYRLCRWYRNNNCVCPFTDYLYKLLNNNEFPLVSLQVLHSHVSIIMQTRPDWDLISQSSWTVPAAVYMIKYNTHQLQCNLLNL